jgi:hypothetical protein
MMLERPDAVNAIIDAAIIRCETASIPAGHDAATT